jgi:hypothetical protein
MTPITNDRRNEIRSLEGRRVSVALLDGSRIDDSQLVSAGTDGSRNIWLHSNHVDIFVRLHEIADFWEVLTPGCSDAS